MFIIFCLSCQKYNCFDVVFSAESNTHFSLIDLFWFKFHLTQWILPNTVFLQASYEFWIIVKNKLVDLVKIKTHY